MAPAGTWIKMTIAGLGMAVGGPALVYYVSPSEEEIFKKYNPELQRRSLEGRIQKQEEFDTFVKHLKEYSKSDKHIWEAAAEAEEKRREEARQQQKAQRTAVADEIKKQRMDMEYSISESVQRASEDAAASPPKRKGFWAS